MLRLLVQSMGFVRVVYSHCKPISSLVVNNKLNSSPYIKMSVIARATQVQDVHVMLVLVAHAIQVQEAWQRIVLVFASRKIYVTPLSALSSGRLGY